MTINDLIKKIKDYPKYIMQFCIEDVFSWKGMYSEPACSLSTRCVDKEHNIIMLERLLSEKFEGWGSAYYGYDNLHFEDNRYSWSNNQYLFDFLLDNSDNDSVRFIFHSLQNK